MASLPWNMRKGVTYYISIDTPTESGMMKGTFLGKMEDGFYWFRRPGPSGEKFMVVPSHVVGASAVRS